MVLAEIITIGDELLIGQVVDTNSAWMGQKLNEAGIRVFQKTAVSDNEEHIIAAFNEAEKRADVILVTGGLGPTKDDLTKITLCKYFKSNLRFDEKVFLDIEKIFKARGREVTKTNRSQAEVPEKCTVIHNSMGTAPGMWFEKKNKFFVSMPGVPYEMKAMMEKDVLRMLKENFRTPHIFHKTVLTQGIGESYLSDLIETWENSLPPTIKLAYLPSPGLVRMRLSGSGNLESEVRQEIAEEMAKLHSIAGKYIYGYDDDTLESLVAGLLKEKKLTVSTAESCTGGYIAHRITTVPGSSEYYKGSVVAYHNEIKTKFLEVDAQTISEKGVVSEEVVNQMALHIKNKFKTDCSIACSGIAGPDGGTPEKPVGTVWIAVATPGGVVTRKLQLGDNRERVIIETCQHSLNLFRKILAGESIS
ncbi:MAG: competence/damage-inducible protein A [Bacteroidetes bacterium]|nr:competence/damage-inducible protein A [Bacteroidota bacterium]